jgi:hypothetical protein
MLPLVAFTVWCHPSCDPKLPFWASWLIWCEPIFFFFVFFICCLPKGSLQLFVASIFGFFEFYDDASRFYFFGGCYRFPHDVENVSTQSKSHTLTDVEDSLRYVDTTFKYAIRVWQGFAFRQTWSYRQSLKK